MLICNWLEGLLIMTYSSSKASHCNMDFMSVCCECLQDLSVRPLSYSVARSFCGCMFHMYCTCTAWVCRCDPDFSVVVLKKRIALCPLHFSLLHTVDAVKCHVKGRVHRDRSHHYHIKQTNLSPFAEQGSTELTGLFLEKPPESVVAVAGEKQRWMDAHLSR